MFVSIPVIVITPIIFAIFAIIAITTIIDIDRDNRKFIDRYRTERDQLEASLDEKNRIIENLENQNFEMNCKIIPLQSEVEYLRDMVNSLRVRNEELFNEKLKESREFRAKLNAIQDICMSIYVPETDDDDELPY